ncbi:MAG: helix-turn-helix domain-containing protein [Clostridiales bacterium]|jgi:carbohydrate diacid regulator|nr:helix-turn-helix domain-containing protein [Clostridiales bacterium]
MLSNQILQNSIDGLKAITRRDVTVVEREGKVTATTEPEMFNRFLQEIEAFISSPADSQIVQGYQYFKVLDNGVVEYVVMIRGKDEEAFRLGKIASFQIQNLLVAYKERYDRDNFIKNLLLDNMLLVDIYSRAKKLHVDNDVRRVVFLIDIASEMESSVIEILRNMFPVKLKEFIIALDQNSIILVKELSAEDDAQSIDAAARAICDTLNTEAMISATVATGMPVNDLKHVSASYKEARMALEVGKIFDTEKKVINYEQLGIGRLIYQLPVQLCRMFIDEVLHGISIDTFDDEMLTTVSKFFENNLNVSETSRQLYIHRNTLVYRLDKLQKMTGLDLRAFEDAITFKITLMVGKYMKFKENFLY